MATEEDFDSRLNVLDPHERFIVKLALIESLVTKVLCQFGYETGCKALDMTASVLAAWARGLKAGPLTAAAEAAVDPEPEKVN